MVYSSELGHHASRVYRDQDGNFVVPKSAAIVVQSSGLIRNENYAAVTDASSSIPPIGFTRVLSSIAQTYSLAAPPYVGVEKTIMMFSTALNHIRSAVPINFTTGQLRVINMKNDTTRTSTASQAVPTIVTLYGASTALWVIKAFSGSTVAMTFTSST